MKNRALTVLVASLMLAVIAAAGAASADTVLSNVAAYKPTTSSNPYSTSYKSWRGNDDQVTSANFFHAVIGDSSSWWRVDLGADYTIESLEVIARWSATYMDPDTHINGGTIWAYDSGGVRIGTNEVLLAGYSTSPFVPVVDYDVSSYNWTGVRYLQVGGGDMGIEPTSPSAGLQMAELRAYAQVATYEGFISGVSVSVNAECPVYSTTHPDVQLDHLVNNAGMLDQGAAVLGDPAALSAYVHGGHWHTGVMPETPTTEELPVLTFDLGGSHNLERMLIWNRNAPDLVITDYPGATVLREGGFKDVTIATSTDGSVYTALADENGDADGNFTIAMSYGGDSVYQADVDLSGITASYVRITGLNSYGYNSWGLSEVRFYEAAAVPMIPGDATGEGVVDEDDAAVLAANWGMASGATWAMGDFTDDGAVNAADASIMAANWGYGAGETTTVPEPSGLILLLGSFVATVLWRVKR